MFFSRQFIQFAAVGAAGTTVQYVTLWAGVEILAAPAVISSAVGYVLGSVINYLLNYFFTFESGQSHIRVASKYYTVLGVGWCINYALMKILVDHISLHYWFAQVFTTGVGLMWNFIGSKWWVFKGASA
jgi:putative flippase GtrA